MAEEMGKRLNQSIVVVNRPGAGGNVGMAQAARAKPDGYTVVLSWTGPLATNLALYRDVGWNPSRDLVPVGMVGCTPNVLAVSPAFPASSFPASSTTRVRIPARSPTARPAWGVPGTSRARC
ncbi:Bug family tripartite tricarboxylate transporter substrate binding protein [Pseudoroseomonas wenyumeiae]